MRVRFLPPSAPTASAGIAYRECSGGQLGDVKNDMCKYKLPEKLGYENNNMEFVLNTEVSNGKQSYRNLITEFFM